MDRYDASFSKQFAKKRPQSSYNQTSMGSTAYNSEVISIKGGILLKKTKNIEFNIDEVNNNQGNLSQQTKKQRKKSLISQKNNAYQGDNIKGSKLKRAFFENYKTFLQVHKPDYIRAVEDHPLMLDALLYSQLNPSALASHQWEKTSVKRNLDQLRNHPYIDDYPNSPRTAKQLNNIRNKVNEKQFRNINQMDKKFFEIIGKKKEKEDDLILDLEADLEKYLKKINQFKKNNSYIYDTHLEDYKPIVKISEQNKNSDNTFDVQQADKIVSLLYKEKKNMKADYLSYLKQKQVEKRDQLFEREEKIDTDINYTKMPIHSQVIKKNYNKPNNNLIKKIKNPNEYQETIYIDGGFNENDVFQNIPKNIPNSGITYSSKQETYV
ncbi:hypothetical protein PPERSA_03844 [Pseudocohnilembus persalinus]|uniref:Uncharacterized protein n=1 Tax=Pseudocohnilembus persalinus TaxID=266149 RepID=A0A0V0QU39_PSEPJ|nr:hypothetical protein PPERSA_03844 [Pseudocohnilembus persalinus]|eukprot:KRX05907.1 hypothetical protein PPERSA_03844 [Pseudocohnilembus persalinus]